MVQIIPQPERKFPPLERIFFYFSIVIFFFSLFYYFYLFSQVRVYQKKIEEIEKKISSFKTPEMEKIEHTILETKEKISNFSELIKSRYFASKFFPFLENRVHPKIYFSKIEVNFENLEALLFGQSEDFYSLHQQYKILSEDPKLKTSLENISLTKEGTVEFSFKINFKRDILK